MMQQSSVSKTCAVCCLQDINNYCTIQYKHKYMCTYIYTLRIDTCAHTSIIYHNRSTDIGEHPDLDITQITANAFCSEL